jgi:hypothetical protein
MGKVIRLSFEKPNEYPEGQEGMGSAQGPWSMRDTILAVPQE